MNTYGWGPNGHPIKLGGNYSGGTGDTISEHWDGDDVLFENSQIGLTDVQVGKLAAGKSSSDFTIADRDMTGQQVSSHTATAFGAWDGGPPTHQCSACSKGEGDKTIPGSVDSTWVSNDQPSSYNPNTTFLSGVREDGYNDGFGNTFQGVRAYDPNVGQWTSPDAYAGDVDDPMSQKPFMWNDDNPIEYGDPSGYCGKKIDVSDPTCTIATVMARPGPEEVARRLDAMAPNKTENIFWVLAGFIPAGRGGQVAKDAAEGVTGEGLMEGAETLGQRVAETITRDASNANNLHHVFDNANHGLDAFLSSYGGNQTEAFTAVANAVRTLRLPEGQVFRKEVLVNGYRIEVRGIIENAAPRLSTFYIKR